MGESVEQGDWFARLMELSERLGVRGRAWAFERGLGLPLAEDWEGIK